MSNYNQRKAVVTCGCSISDAQDGLTWPCVLEDTGHFTEYLHLGYGSSAGDFAARKAIYGINKMLKTYDADQITLILFWTTPNRKSFVFDSNSISKWTKDFQQTYDKKEPYFLPQCLDYENRKVDHINSPDWRWINTPCEHDFSYTWFTTFDSDASQLERRLWDMLAVQNYCDLKGVNYIYANVNDSFQNLLNNDYHNFYSHLLDEINFNYDLLPNNNTTDFLISKGNCITDYMTAVDDIHPNIQGHKKIVHDLLIPKLQKMGIV